MHVLVTADTLGGVWTYTRELVTGLSSRGHRVTLVSFGDIPSMEQAAWIAPLKNVDYRPTAFRLEWMQDSESDMAASAKYLLSVVDEVKPDLLHLSQFYYGDLVCDAPRIVVAHSDVVTWWLAVHGKEPPESEWIRQYRSAVKRTVSGSTIVVAPSQWMLKAFEQSHGRPQKTAVIYNGRAPALMNAYAPKKNTALSVGRIWDMGKNAALLTRISSPLPVHVIGSNENPSGHTKAVDLQSCEARGIFFKGPQTAKEMRDLYAGASVYIATSQYEPFGLAPLEAAFSRCAIVASDIPSFREIWGHVAVYFKANDARSLQQTLEILAANPNVVLRAGNEAYQHAMKRYLSSRMVGDYLELYKTLVPAEVLAA